MCLLSITRRQLVESYGRTILNVCKCLNGHTYCTSDNHLSVNLGRVPVVPKETNFSVYM